MHITSITLKGYKPLLHNAVEEITVQFPCTLTLIIGDNGSGKSSMLRELSPLPAISSDYEKNGLKSLTIEHGKSVYILTSDFSNSKHTHSFLRDNEELNESGNSGLQQELCSTEFGYTSTIDALTKFQYKLTGLTRSQRKALFFELYPGDISFLLDEHKHMCSQIRKHKNNLSMLDEMKSDVTDRLVSDDRMRNLETRKKELVDQQRSLDAVMFDVERELKELRSSSAYHYTGEKFTLEDLDTEMENITSAVLLTRIHHQEWFEDKSFETQLAVMNAEQEHRHSQINQLAKRADQIRVKLAEYEAIKNTNTKDEITRYENISKNMEQAIAGITVLSDMPTMGEEELFRYTERTLPKLNDLLEHIISSGAKPMKAEDISQLKDVISDLSDRAVKENIMKEEAIAELDRYSTELEGRNDDSPPEDCDRTCALRKNYLGWVTRMKNEVDRLKKAISIHEKNITTYEQQIAEHRKTLAGPLSIKEQVDELLNIFSWESWSEYITGDRNLFDIVRDSTTTIFPALEKLRVNNENRLKLEKFKLEKKQADDRLVVLYKLRGAEEYGNKLRDAAIEETVTLNNTLDEMSKLEAQINRVKCNVQGVRELHVMHQRIEYVRQSFDKYATHLMLVGAEEYNELLRKSISEEKDRVTNELVEIENTMQRQSELKARLRESIEPRIKATNTALDISLKIEPTLAKLPYRHITRFINNILTTMNSIIHNVWGYGLEMKYLDEDGILDFSLPVMINEGTVMSDCNTCSAGESEILNLTATLAICRILHLSEQYPIRMDEPDSALSHGNRNRLAVMISKMLEDGHVGQMFLIDHFHALFNAFHNTDVVCMKPDNVILPEEYNNNVTIK